MRATAAGLVVLTGLANPPPVTRTDVQIGAEPGHVPACPRGSPNGAFEDSFYLAIGRQLWDASLVRAATLILRSERDFWSRPEDVARFEQHLVHAARVKVVALAGATHHVHLDRPERGRAQLLEEILAFLRS